MKETDFIIVSGLDKPRFWSYYQHRQQEFRKGIFPGDVVLSIFPLNYWRLTPSGTPAMFGLGKEGSGPEIRGMAMPGGTSIVHGRGKA